MVKNELESRFIALQRAAVINSLSHQDRACRFGPRPLPSSQDSHMTQTLSGRLNLGVYVGSSSASNIILFTHILGWVARMVGGRFAAKLLVGMLVALAASCSTGTMIGNASAWSIHDPISIGSDGEFTGENGVVEGTGSPEDPYIIEGWQITDAAG
ncbi:MAG: hypothetical protein MUO84_06630, partial [Thermoplasmata archaeon]|nr:hypothetical protein [Thermoplasmata archaeon]